MGTIAAIFAMVVLIFSLLKPGNRNFYSGLIYRDIGIPTNMFTVLFVMGRLPGWIAHWKEMHDSVPFKIGRPRQIYIGESERKVVPASKRKGFSLFSIFRKE